MKKYLYNIYFEFRSDTRITKHLLKHSKIYIDGIPKTTWVVEHFRAFRCSIWVLRRPGMGGSRAPRPLCFTPVNRLQGEEDVNDSHKVIFILLPRSLHQMSWWVDWIQWCGSLGRNWEYFQFGAPREMEVGASFHVYLLGDTSLLLDPGFTDLWL